MEKTVFRNQTFLTLLIIGLLLLLLWNSLIFIATFNLLLLIPIVVQMILLMLIISKNKYAKTGIKLWTILLIGGPALSILGKLLLAFSGDEIGPKLWPLVFRVIILIFGILVYHYTDTTVEVEIVENEDPTKKT